MPLTALLTRYLITKANNQALHDQPGVVYWSAVNLTVQL